jgi:pimeloyl-ACP methyl ester carboxylesterase
VHGFGANTYSWERATLQPLAEKLNATAVAHDAPGFGLTERVGDLKRYTPRTNAAIARAMLDLAEGTLNEEDGSKKEKTWNDVVGEMSSEANDATKTKKKLRARRVVVGHSMGGVAAAIAAAEGDIDDVVLVAPAVIAASARAAGDLPETRKEKKRTLCLSLLGAFARAFRVVVAFAASPVVLFAVRKLVRSASFWRDGLGKAVGAAARARMRTDATWADGYRRPSAVTGWDAGMVRVVLAAATGGVSLARAILGATSPTAEADKPENIIEALRLSKARVLIVHGSDDMIVPVGNSRRLKELIPRAEMVEMPGVGHMPHEEAPEAFLDAVTAFVDETVTRLISLRRITISQERARSRLLRSRTHYTTLPNTFLLPFTSSVQPQSAHRAGERRVFPRVVGFLFF